MNKNNEQIKTNIRLAIEKIEELILLLKEDEINSGEIILAPSIHQQILNNFIPTDRKLTLIHAQRQSGKTTLTKQLAIKANNLGHDCIIVSPYEKLIKKEFADKQSKKLVEDNHIGPGKTYIMSFEQFKENLLDKGYMESVKAVIFDDVDYSDQKFILNNFFKIMKYNSIVMLGDLSKNNFKNCIQPVYNVEMIYIDLTDCPFYDNTNNSK